MIALCFSGRAYGQTEVDDARRPVHALTMPQLSSSCTKKPRRREIPFLWPQLGARMIPLRCINHLRDARALWVERSEQEPEDGLATLVTLRRLGGEVTHYRCWLMQGPALAGRICRTDLQKRVRNWHRRPQSTDDRSQRTRRLAALGRRPCGAPSVHAGRARQPTARGAQLRCSHRLHRDAKRLQSCPGLVVRLQIGLVCSRVAGPLAYRSPLSRALDLATRRRVRLRARVTSGCASSARCVSAGARQSLPACRRRPLRRRRARHPGRDRSHSRRS